MIKQKEDFMIDTGSELAIFDYRNEPQQKKLILHHDRFFLSFIC